MITIVPDSKSLQPNKDQRSVQVGRQRLADSVSRGKNTLAADIIKKSLKDPTILQLFDTVFSHSPFLTSCMIGEINCLAEILSDGYKTTFENILSSLSTKTLNQENDDSVTRQLRIARRRAALTIGLADISNSWNVEEVTEALSKFADHSISLVVKKLLIDSHETGEIKLTDPNEPTKDSGFIILAVGKLGGRELNYSSDVDLILLFDPDLVNYIGKHSSQEFFIRLGKQFIKFLEEHTKDGYVFRTDTRLRPDPGSTPLVMSTRAAEVYYESMGQNWERAALIKARPVGGDIEAGNRFINYLRPFIWRKSLDFYAIQDIHSIKRQIYAKHGGDQITVPGHNIKLGRGGIREIEFFTQTLQLIWGGRQPNLRISKTCNALMALTDANHLGKLVTKDLIDAYKFLRKVEHRLQMINDQQTHTIPKEINQIDKFSEFMGFPKSDDFITELSLRLRTVENHYASLFEESPPLSTIGTLAFTGEDDHPDTLKTLTSMGFSDVVSISAVIRKWHHGRYAATRSARAREILTELMPSLLEAFSKTRNPDTGLLRFNDLLASLPAGIQILSLLYANSSLLKLLAEIMGSTPFLAAKLRKHPILLESMITADFFEYPTCKKNLLKEIDAGILEARNFEELLSVLCRQVNDHLFQVGVHILSGRIKPIETQKRLTDLAEKTLGTLYSSIKDSWTEKHGNFDETGMAIIAMGKLGGREMTLGSDLDLCFIYQDTEGGQSNGLKPLLQTTYYNRLGQRLLGILSSQNGEGTLYEVDMRLRPNGSSGPLASALKAFKRYYLEDAWTWEYMALTRARVVYGPPALKTNVEDLIFQLLTLAPKEEKLVCDVFDMRTRIYLKHPDKQIWDVKNKRGGLLDIEFIAQYLQLRYAAKDSDILATNTFDALTSLSRRGYLSSTHAQHLIHSLYFWQNLQGALRLLYEKTINGRSITEENRSLLAHLCDLDSASYLEEKIADIASDNHAIFQEIIENPAKSLSGKHPVI